MAEIKLNDNFAAEVSAFRASGDQLDLVSINSIHVDDLSLPTVEAYQDRLFKIRTLIIKFQLLTQKDANDMDELANSLRETDSCGD